MASMGDMPNIAGKEIAISPWHFYSLRGIFFRIKKAGLRLKTPPFKGSSPEISNGYTGPSPEKRKHTANLMTHESRVDLTPITLDRHRAHRR